MPVGMRLVGPWNFRNGRIATRAARLPYPDFMRERAVVTLCMIVKNEERRLQACLDSARDVIGELIVVDTGSTDATPEIAARNGAEVIKCDFAFVDFAAARNHGIARATGRWILVLDADETLHPASLPLVRAFACGNENAGYYLARRNYVWDSDNFTTDYAVRLFPNRPDYRYHGRVHETVDSSILRAGGRLLKSGIQIDHYCSDKPDAEARRRKHHWYIRILQEEIAADPADTTRLDFLAAEYHQLGMFPEATEVAERIVRARPLDASAHLNAGIYHLMFAPDLVQARKDFNRALELKPGYPEAVSFLQTLNGREHQASAGAIGRIPN